MKKLFISEDIPYNIESMLCGMGLSLVKLKKEKDLPLPTQAHADMLLFSDGDRVITTEKYYNGNKELFKNTAVTVTRDNFGNRYPYDIIFNAFVINNTLFGKTEYLSRAVTELFENKINLKQGYAKCSTLIFGNNVITADNGIYKALSDFGISALLINEGSISLPGYNYGFIGGASFVYKNKVIFFGDITAHPDHNSIKAFIESKDFEIIYEKSLPLTDFGGAILDKNKAL